MLVAISTVTKSRILASDVDRKHPCTCPECQQVLVLKRGRIVIAHFAHPARTQCPLSAGETVRHLRMKQQLAAYFGSQTRVELEWICAPGRRADLFLPDLKIVVECQQSPMLIEEWEVRTWDYIRHGYQILWVWDIGRVYGRGKTEFPEQPDVVITDGYGSQRAREYRVPAEIRHCHDKFGDLIFVLDGSGILKACRLRWAAERCNEYYDEDGILQESEYVPETLKSIVVEEPEIVLKRFLNLIERKG